MTSERSLVPTIDELNTYVAMSKTAAQSKLFDKIGGEAGILSIMLMARELGLPAFQSIMGGMNVIQGKVELSPRLMNSMIRSAGHKIEILTKRENEDKECILRGTRHDTKEEYEVAYTIDDARKAGLVRSGGGWERYASDMLFARCLSRLARRLFADVISSAYVEGEIEREPRFPEKAPKEPLDVDSLPKVTPVQIPEEKLTLDSFITIMKEHEEGFNGYKLEEYLNFLSGKKEVDVDTIMKQALVKGFTSQFLKGYRKWLERITAENSEPEGT